jgi:putative ABC transport system permease protein
MKITGVLARSHSPDDLAVFVDTKTAWIVQGLGHGHQDLAKTCDASVILNQDERNVTANARLMQYTEITADNFDSFHFHGDDSGYPLTAVLVLPDDIKSAAILRGLLLQAC